MILTSPVEKSAQRPTLQVFATQGGWPDVCTQPVSYIDPCLLTILK